MPQTGRVDWVDYAKGFCIIMVVMMHSTLGVEKAVGAEGWMHAVVAFAKPFRMPDFFMISGLFLARVIDRDWSSYLDKKVVHFAYFYVLWLTIQFAFKAPGIAADDGTDRHGPGLSRLVRRAVRHDLVHLPPADLLRRRQSGAAPAVVAALARRGGARDGACADRLDHRRRIRQHASSIFSAAMSSRRRSSRLPRASSTTAGEPLPSCSSGRSPRDSPSSAAFRNCRFVSLALGLVGAVAVVSFAALLSKSDLMAPVRYCGRNSIVIYLAFFLPMAVSRAALLKLGVIDDLGTISLIVTGCGVIGPLVLFWAVRGTPLRLLFERPAWARLKPAAGRVLQPAE